MITQEINLNMIPDSEPVVVRVNQYDVGTKRLKINLFDGETPYVTPGGSSAVIQGTKPDKHGFSYYATLKGSGGRNSLPVTLTSGSSGGISYTVSTDKTITFNGTNNSGSSVFVHLFTQGEAPTVNLVPGLEYTLCGCPINGTTDNHDYFLDYSQVYEKDGQRYGQHATDYGNGNTFTARDDRVSDLCYICIDNGVTMSNVKIKPMIKSAGDTDPSYEPYISDIPTQSYVLADITQQMTAVHGDVRTQIVVTEPNGKTGTFVFILRVQESALQDDTDISDTELPAIIDAAESNAERAEQAAEDAQEWASHSPYIDPNTSHWWVYDATRHEFVDTGISADGSTTS